MKFETQATIAVFAAYAIMYVVVGILEEILGVAM